MLVAIETCQRHVPTLWCDFIFKIGVNGLKWIKSVFCFSDP